MKFVIDGDKEFDGTDVVATFRHPFDNGLIVAVKVAKGGLMFKVSNVSTGSLVSERWETWNEIFPERGTRAAPPAAQEWVARVIAATDAAIKEFGRKFYDRGPCAVMGIDFYAEQLRGLDATVAGVRLEALAVCGDDYRRTARAILVQLDSSEVWWGVCCAACPTVEY